MAMVIEELLKIIKPTSACEVGCGLGRHLFHYSTVFPDTDFSGFDIASSAIEGAKNLQNGEMIDLQLPGQDRTLNSDEMAKARDINFFCADASNLADVPDNAYDVVYSVHALEQMSDRLDAVFSELARVARRYVIFAEPFWDCNDPMGKLFLYTHNYFHASLSDVSAAGLKMIKYMDVLPQKPTFKYAVYVGKVETTDGS